MLYKKFRPSLNNVASVYIARSEAFIYLLAVNISFKILRGKKLFLFIPTHAPAIL